MALQTDMTRNKVLVVEACTQRFAAETRKLATVNNFVEVFEIS